MKVIEKYLEKTNGLNNQFINSKSNFFKEALESVNDVLGFQLTHNQRSAEDQVTIFEDGTFEVLKHVSSESSKYDRNICISEYNWYGRKKTYTTDGILMSDNEYSY